MTLFQKQSAYGLGDIGAFGASMLAGKLGGGAAVSGLSHLLTEEGRGMGHTSPQRVQALLDQVRAEHDLDVGYEHAPEIVGSNAGYMRPGVPEKIVGDLRKALDDPKSKVPGSKTYIHPTERRQYSRMIAKLEGASRPGGLVLTGTHFKKPGTVEHELGHAIAGSRGNILERAATNTEADPFYYHTLPSYLAAFLGARKGSPLMGAVAGGLTGLATSAPTLYAEYAANRYGDQLLDPAEKDKHGKWKGYGTYLAGAGIPAALTGALYGLFRRKMKI